jgi:hypothetical protein
MIRRVLNKVSICTEKQGDKKERRVGNVDGPKSNQKKNEEWIYASIRMKMGEMGEYMRIYEEDDVK